MDCSPPWRLYSGDFPGKNTGVGCHFLLQGIFPTQRSNPRLLHWQADSLQNSSQSHQGSPTVGVEVGNREWIDIGKTLPSKLKDKILLQYEIKISLWMCDRIIMNWSISGKTLAFAKCLKREADFPLPHSSVQWKMKNSSSTWGLPRMLSGSSRLRWVALPHFVRPPSQFRRISLPLTGCGSHPSWWPFW